MAWIAPWDIGYNYSNKYDFVSSEELNREIEADCSSSDFESSANSRLTSFGYSSSDLESSACSRPTYFAHSTSTYSSSACDDSNSGDIMHTCSSSCNLKRYPFISDDFMNKDFMLLVNPRTGQRVNIYGDAESVDSSDETMPSWDHDHDYSAKKQTAEKAKGRESEKAIKSESEPSVDVWKIENFPKDPETSLKPTCDWRRFADMPVRRTSTRSTSASFAKLKEAVRLRSLKNILCAELNEKAKRKRTYKKKKKNNKPKNSVETTPSQSDIEEWSGYPARKRRCTKVTKKKTAKSRIDHSESERRRREVLRENFADLRSLIPIEFLRGEKPSSQISKQKILNGSKAYLNTLLSCRNFYKNNFHSNRQMKDNWPKKTTVKLQRRMKKK